MDDNTVTGATTEAQAPFDWRHLLDVHPAAKLFKPLPEPELNELAEDIKTNGLRAPIVVWSPSDDPSEDPVLLDGVNRLDALARLGLLYEIEDGDHLGIGLRIWNGEKWLDGLSGGTIRHEYVYGDPYALAVSYNIRRRHLTPEDKRDLIAKLLSLQPETSNRQIADIVKADHKTVGRVRAEKEATGEIPQLKKTKGKDGKKRSARRRTSTPKAAPPAPKKTTSPKPKRTTALDALAVWKDLPEAEHRRFFDGIGLNAILAGIPEAWLPALEEWIAKRRISAAPRVPQ